MNNTPDMFGYVPPTKSRKKNPKATAAQPKSSASPPGFVPIYGPSLWPTLCLAGLIGLSLLWVTYGTQIKAVGPVEFENLPGPVTGALIFFALVFFGVWFAASAINAARRNFMGRRDRCALKYYASKWKAYFYRFAITVASLLFFASASFMALHCSKNAKSVAITIADKVGRMPDMEVTEVAENLPTLKPEVYGPPAPIEPPKITGSISKSKPRREKVEKAPVEKVDPLADTFRDIGEWFRKLINPGVSEPK